MVLIRGYSSSRISHMNIPRIIEPKNIKLKILSLVKKALICVPNVVDTIIAYLSKLFKVVFISCVIVHSSSSSEIKQLIGRYEALHAIPKGLLVSIAKVESKLSPYAVNSSYKRLVGSDMNSAIEAVEYLSSQGVSNIDVGIMQLNYRWHRNQFNSIAHMLDVNSNIDYAAKFLKSLYEKHGSWQKAVRHYHSANSKHHTRYSRRIIQTWLEEL